MLLRYSIILYFFSFSELISQPHCQETILSSDEKELVRAYFINYPAQKWLIGQKYGVVSVFIEQKLTNLGSQKTWTLYPKYTNDLELNKPSGFIRYFDNLLLIYEKGENSIQIECLNKLIENRLLIEPKEQEREVNLTISGFSDDKSIQTGPKKFKVPLQINSNFILTGYFNEKGILMQTSKSSIKRNL